MRWTARERAGSRPPQQCNNVSPHCPSSPEPHHDIDEHTSHPPPATPSQVTMLLLDYQNVLIQSVLTERFSG